MFKSLDHQKGSPTQEQPHELDTGSLMFSNCESDLGTLSEADDGNSARLHLFEREIFCILSLTPRCGLFICADSLPRVTQRNQTDLEKA